MTNIKKNDESARNLLIRIIYNEKREYEVNAKFKY